MPYIKVFIHFVWSTKNRIPFLGTKEIRHEVWQHIRTNSQEKGIYVDFVGGFDDHCHCLVSLGSEQTICKIMQSIKGESSYWINKQHFFDQKFEWQNDYFAVSVSGSVINRVRDYIKNQEEHHKRKTFTDEYEEFIIKYGFQRMIDE